MAKAAAAPKLVDAAAPAAPKRGKKLLLVLVALVLVIVLLGAGFVGLLLWKKSSAAQESDEVEAVATFDLSKPPTFVTLEPFVVNLSPEEGDRFLQVVLALRVGDAKTGEKLSAFMPEIRHQINLLLSGKRPSELSTPQGREALANEIVERSNGVLGGGPAKGADKRPNGPIEAVLFNSFIIQ